MCCEKCILLVMYCFQVSSALMTSVYCVMSSVGHNGNCVMSVRWNYVKVLCTLCLFIGLKIIFYEMLVCYL